MSAFDDFAAANDAKAHAQAISEFAAKAGVDQATASQMVNATDALAISTGNSVSLVATSGPAAAPVSVPVATTSTFHLPIILGVVGIVLTVAFALGRK